jgi:quercetin dioxygenase-like cupin family protein
MQSRRGFGTFVTCAICAAAGLVATGASAQTAPPAATPGITRKILSQTDGPTPGYVTILAEATVDAGNVVGRHTHPGIESGYVLEGSIEVPIEGRPTRIMQPGDSFQIPAGTPHAGGKVSAMKVRILSTYVVEKGKPLASPA